MDSQRQSTTSDEDRFGLRLRQERTRLGLTQAQVAAKLAEEENVHLHPSAIAKMETRGSERARTITLNEAAAVARVLGVPLDEMFGETSGKLSDVVHKAHRFVSAVDHLSEANRDLDAAFAQASRVLERIERSEATDRLLAESAFMVSYSQAKLDELIRDLGMGYPRDAFDRAVGVYLEGEDYRYMGYGKLTKRAPGDAGEREKLRDELRGRYEAGESLSSISADTGYPRLTVAWLLWERGGTIRDKPEDT